MQNAQTFTEAANWLVAEAWEQIHNEKPQTEAFIQPEDLGPDDPEYSALLEAAEFLKDSNWIYFQYHYSLSHEGPRSIGNITFTLKATRCIEGQLEDNPDSAPVFRQVLGL